MRSVAILSWVVVGCFVVCSGCPGQSVGGPNDNTNSAGPLCGDGQRDGTEECDGTELEGQTCQSLGFWGGTLACASDCTLDKEGCFDLDSCGDGVVDAPEACDDGNDEPWDGCGDCRITEIRVNSDAVSGYGPDVAMSADGGFVVGWESFHSGLPGIYVRRYASSAHPMIDELEIADGSNIAGRRVAVGMAGDGRFVAAWEHSIGMGEYAWRSEVRRFDSAGALVDDGFELNPAPMCEQARPAVGMFPGGDFVAVWQRECTPGYGDSYENVYAQRFDAAGNPVGEEVMANAAAAHDRRWSDVAVYADGGFVVVWQSLDQDGDGWGIFARRFDAAGIPMGEELAVNATTMGGQSVPKVATSPDGGFVVVWESEPEDPGGYDVYGQRFGADGAPVGSELLINSETYRDQEAPDVAVAADGSFVVVWFGEDPNGEGGNVYGRLFDASGSPRGDDQRLNVQTEWVQAQPAVAMADDGSFVVVWWSMQEDGIDMNANVLMQRFDSQGTPLGLGQ